VVGRYLFQGDEDNLMQNELIKRHRTRKKIEAHAKTILVFGAVIGFLAFLAYAPTPMLMGFIVTFLVIVAYVTIAAVFGAYDD
jgi:hypothetical protein